MSLKIFRSENVFLPFYLLKVILLSAASYSSVNEDKKDLSFMLIQVSFFFFFKSIIFNLSAQKGKVHFAWHGAHRSLSL